MITILRVPGKIPQRFLGKPVFPTPPLGMGIIAAVLRKEGYRVRMKDLNIRLAQDRALAREYEILLDDKLFFEFINGGENKISRILKKLLPDLSKSEYVLLSAPQSMNNRIVTRSVLAIARCNAKVILGGSFEFSHIAEWGLRKKFFDYVVLGPGEKSILQIIKGDKPAKIPGLVYIDKVCKQNPIGSPSNVVPDYSGLNLSDYKQKMLVMPLSFGIGCVRACAFCPQSGLKYHMLSVKKAVELVRETKARYGTQYFMFLNTSINPTSEYLTEFAEEIVKEHVFWSDSIFPAGLKPEIFSKVYQSGCRRLIFGIETASKGLRKRFNKNLDNKEVSGLLRASHRAGIWNGLEIIVGLPGETMDDLRKTIRFIRENEKYIDELYIEGFRAYEESLFAIAPKKYSVKNLVFRKGANFIRKGQYYKRVGGQYETEHSWERITANVQKKQARLRKLFSHKHPLYDNEQLNTIFHLYQKFGRKKKVKQEYEKLRLKEKVITFVDPFLLKHKLSLLAQKK